MEYYTDPSQDTQPVNSRLRDALKSASGNLAFWFLKDNKEKGRSLDIPSLGIIIHADGTIEKKGE